MPAALVARGRGGLCQGMGDVGDSRLQVENRKARPGQPGYPSGVPDVMPRSDVMTRQEPIMPEVTIVYWRDIPAQVIVGRGRGGSKHPLPERFEQAIDRAAMRIGARDSDAYLAEWRKAAPYHVDGDPAEIAAAEAARIVAEYDPARLKALIDNDGRA